MSGVVQFITSLIKIGIVLASLGYLKPVTFFLLTETVKLYQQPQFSLSKFNRTLVDEKNGSSNSSRKSVHKRSAK